VVVYYILLYFFNSSFICIKASFNVKYKLIMLKKLIGSWKLKLGIAKSRYAVSFTNLISVNLLQLFKKEMVRIIKFCRGTAP
jgi:hypothetical protein